MSFGVAVLLTVREMSYLWWKRRALARRDMEPVQVASATAGVESAAGAKARISRRSFAARLKRLRKKSEKQIPRGLKPTRNDKNKGLVMAHLKVRPFKSRCNRFFQQPLKPCPSTCLSLFLLGLFFSASVAAQSPFAPKVSGPLSQRVVAYQIEAKYDPAQHTVDATETLTYRNLTGQPLDRFPFHLYLNAFQPKSTWVHEAHRDGNLRSSRFEDWESKDSGSNEVTSVEVVGMGDLTKQMKFISPDDGNTDDKTVLEVQLPHPVAPGQDVQFRIKFHAKFPEVVARTGYKRTFLLAGQWFPKVGVWWHGAWNCHQFHNTTEFFADFGVFDVKLTVPQYEVVGASGVLVDEKNNPDNTKTVTYHGDDIHDFAWTASPRYKVRESTYQSQMGPIKLRFLMQPAHWSQAERHERITTATLDHFEKWYGPYPYKSLTVVDPEPDSAAGGMEYPTFITGDSSWLMPAGLYLPELVVEHEFGHQYWYGMVATNEFEDAWMDEGINSYTEVKVLDSILGKNTSIMNEAGVTMGEREEQRLTYTGFADRDPIAQKAYDYYNLDRTGALPTARPPAS